MSAVEQSHVARGDISSGNGTARARVVAICVSPGGIPKWPLQTGLITKIGLTGDNHAHQKHNRPDRALSLMDLEIIDQLRDEGFDLQPGTLGENLTAVGLSVQGMAPGTLLAIGDVVLRLEQPRKPCYVLDAIDPRLKDDIIGRCGYMASVVQCGMIETGMDIVTISTN